jgi:hypothetical protein
VPLLLLLQLLQMVLLLLLLLLLPAWLLPDGLLQLLQSRPLPLPLLVPLKGDRRERTVLQYRQDSGSC